MREQFKPETWPDHDLTVTMAASDPLLLLRTALSSPPHPQLTNSSDPTTAASNKIDSLAKATHLYLPTPTPVCLPLTTATRFTSMNPEPPTLVDLRSIYVAWQQKDVTVPEYIAYAADLDKELPDGQKLRVLVFVERIELIAWLEGASGESEFIKPLEGVPASGEDAAKPSDLAGRAAVPTIPGTGAGAQQQMPGGRPTKVIDARLQEIYNGERKLGDRNTVLRGIKPTVWSVWPRPGRRVSLLPATSNSSIGLLPRPQTRRGFPQGQRP